MSKRPVVPGAEGALNRFRMEVAKELGIPDGVSDVAIDTMNLNTKIQRGGNIGGEMVRRMIQHVEQEMANDTKS